MSQKLKETKEIGMNWHPLQTIYKAALIAAASLILGLVVPGMIAHHGGVFYGSDMARNFDALSKNPNIRLVPFFINPVMYAWVAMYTVLGWLVFLTPPWQKRSVKPSTRLRATVLIATGIYIIWEWPLWMRNFVLDRHENRVVYAFANHDIYKASFFTQEANIIIFAVLLAVLWQQWSSFFLKRRDELAKPLKGNFCDAAFDYSTIERLSKTYIHWQIASLILVPGFIGFSSGYWNLVVRLKDPRYLLSAVTIHILWGITWILISLPLLTTWYSWQSIRVRALSEIATELSENNEHAATKLKVLAEIQPIGFWSVATSGIVAFVSFALPIIQAFLNRR